MNKLILDSLLQDVISSGSSVDYGEPVGERSDIELVEQALGLVFCEDYRWFLETYGSLLISNTSYCGIWPGSSESYGTVLGETKSLRRQYPNIASNYTVLVNESDEWWEVIDNANGAVFSFDPASHSLDILSNTFEGYLEKSFSRHAGVFL